MRANAISSYSLSFCMQEDLDEEGNMEKVDESVPRGTKLSVSTGISIFKV